MSSRRLTAADRPDTWDAGWDERLSRHLSSLGAGSAWEYVRARPGQTYAELAETIAAAAGFGAAPIQIERLQVRDTPQADVPRSVRDSLARHLLSLRRCGGWGRGPYWESRAIGAMASWSAMWSGRLDLGAAKHRLFEIDPPKGWIPVDGADAVLVAVFPDA